MMIHNVVPKIILPRDCGTAIVESDDIMFATLHDDELR